MDRARLRDINEDIKLAQAKRKELGIGRVSWQESEKGYLRLISSAGNARMSRPVLVNSPFCYLEAALESPGAASAGFYDVTDDVGTAGSLAAGN